MGIFGKLIKTTIDLATLPVDMAKDVLTMGGALDDQKQPYTVQKLKTLGDDVKEIGNELDK